MVRNVTVSPLLLAICLTAQPGAADEKGVDFFETKIRPVLVEHCYKCHSAESKSLKGDLRLDVRLPTGSSIVVPGKPDESLLIHAIRYTNSDLQMPPVGKLPDAVIADFVEWVRTGASDPRKAASDEAETKATLGAIDLEKGREHWAFQPIRNPAPPEVRDASWSESPIDGFVLARLEANGLTPSPPADRGTLLRRMTFDLTGLPPSSEDLEAFLADESSDGLAVARVVDRLLASPAYAERWGRHWLDVARYGDCNGGDESMPFPNAYHYRNYVIDAFNRDLPYDRFVAEQVAGDLLEPQFDQPEPYDPFIGTGFLVLATKIVAEQDVGKMQADVVDEQLDTFGRAFLGLTLGCARCHDHKFDPLPTTDYYGLAGILKSTRTMSRPGVTMQRSARTKEVFASGAEFRRLYAKRVEELVGLIANAEERMTAASEVVPRIEFEAETYARGNVNVQKDRYGKGIGIVGDSGEKEHFFEYDLEIDAPGEYSIQFRYAGEQSRPGRLLLNGEVLVEKALARTTRSWNPDGQRWFPEAQFAFPAGKSVLRFETGNVLPHIDKVRLALVEGNLRSVLDEFRELEAEKVNIETKRPTPVTVMAVDEGETKDDRVHIRGSHLRLGDEVPRRFLQVIAGENQPPLPEDQSGRLELVEWMASIDHPLTSRVMVNRLWRWHFGRGIVGTTDNFGTRGDRPSHPVLLDWLAREFVRGDWSIKALHRRILLSKTYRMAFRRDESAEEIDPVNRLLWRAHRRRLEAEAIRDALLFVSDSIDFEIGGANLTLKTIALSPEDLETNRKFYEESRRRTVYLPVLRTNVFDFLTTFDFANPDFTTGSRGTTTVPTQALLMANSPYVEEQARRLARSALALVPGDDDAARIEVLYSRLFSRSPSDSELAIAQEFLQDYGETLGEAVTSVRRTNRERRNSPDERRTNPDERRIELWTELCHTFFSSNEFFYID